MRLEWRWTAEHFADLVNLDYTPPPMSLRRLRCLPRRVQADPRASVCGIVSKRESDWIVLALRHGQWRHTRAVDLSDAVTFIADVLGCEVPTLLEER